MFKHFLAMVAAFALCLIAVPATAHAEDSTNLTTCANGTVVDGDGLCYSRCDPGFTGIGPVCWGTCADGFHDDGALCRKDAVIYAKPSYGRGAGTPLGCPAGQVLDGALCYPACRDGYSGVGPVCWQNCPSDHHDDGAFCRRDADIISADTSHCPGYDICGLTLDKGCSICPDGYHNDGCTCRRDADIFAKDTYGRGAGSVVSTCPANEQKDGALCYPTCQAGYTGVGPVCWKSCDEGFHDDGALCRKDAVIVVKASKVRGAGNVPDNCTSSNFTKAISTQTDPDSFTMLFSSDPQLTWWERDPICVSGDTSCVDLHGKKSNEDQVAGLNNITQAQSSAGVGKWPTGEAIQAPQGLVINGDLTAYWHPAQVDLFEDYYNNPNSLKLPVYLGLGNHDYANNVKDCTWARDPNYGVLGDNGCANNAVDFLKATVSCNKVPGFPAARVSSFDNNSLAYSWDVGDYHFVQLNNYPLYVESSLKVASSVSWLKTNLTAATKAGKRIVLNMHDPGTDKGNANEHWDAGDAGFQDAIKGQNVVAIFAGHFHGSAGLYSMVPNTQIPIFLSGASEFNTFLVVKFNRTSLKVAVVNSVGGTPVFAATDAGNSLYSLDVTPLLTHPAGTADGGVDRTGGAGPAAADGGTGTGAGGSAHAVAAAKTGCSAGLGPQLGWMLGLTLWLVAAALSRRRASGRTAR